MKQLFYEGGPAFMGALTVVLILMVAWAIYHFLPLVLKNDPGNAKNRLMLKHIKTLGTLALVVGILGQLIGLIQAFDAIEKMGGVSPALLMGGLKVSMIPTLYGILIYMISLILWLIFDFVASRKLD